MHRKRQSKKNSRRMSSHARAKSNRKNGTSERATARVTQEEGGPVPTFGFPPLP